MSQANADDTTDYTRRDAVNDLDRVVGALAFLEAMISDRKSLADMQEKSTFPAVSGLAALLQSSRKALLRAATHIRP